MKLLLLALGLLAAGSSAAAQKVEIYNACPVTLKGELFLYGEKRTYQIGPGKRLELEDAHDKNTLEFNFGPARGDGRWRWMGPQVAPVYNDEGQIIRYRYTDTWAWIDFDLCKSWPWADGDTVVPYFCFREDFAQDAETWSKYCPIAARRSVSPCTFDSIRKDQCPIWVRGKEPIGESEPRELLRN